MKEFLKKMKNDVEGEGYTFKEILLYGILVPLILVLLMGVAGWMELAFA